MNQTALIVGVVGLVVGAVLAAVYYSARPMPVPLATIPCASAKNYCINVYVVPTPGNPAVPMIAVGTKDVYVQEPRGTKVNVWWIIQNASGQSYDFTGTGVAFGKPPPAVNPPLHEFDPCRVANQANPPPDPPTIAYLCVDNNITRGDFGYTLTLNGNPAVQALDPWIHNN